MEHPADFIEPGRPLRSIQDLRGEFFQSLTGQDDLLKIRAVWAAVSGQDSLRSWPARLEHGVLVVEASGSAAQDLRLKAGQICKTLAGLEIQVKKIVVEMDRKRG